MALGEAGEEPPIGELLGDPDGLLLVGEVKGEKTFFEEETAFGIDGMFCPIIDILFLTRPTPEIDGL